MPMPLSIIPPTRSRREAPFPPGVDEALLEAHARGLEMVLDGALLEDILTDLARVVEDQSDGDAMAAILFLDADGRLRTGGAPSLPVALSAAIEGMATGPGIGTSRQTAAISPVLVTADMASDPRWDELKGLPLGVGLAAAWSRPILASDGRVLGAFGVYFREPRSPSSLERRLVEALSRTAAIAIERRLRERQLEEQQRLLNQALDAAEMGTWRYDLVDWQCEFSERARVLYGMDGLRVRRDIDFVRSIVHPDDLAVVQSALNAAIGPEASGHYSAEYRVRRPDGGWRWLSAWGAVEYEGEGDDRRAAALVGASRDISERKLGEERQQLMLHELNHRVKNTLATVQSIAMQAIRTAPDLDTAGKLIEARLVSLARGHDILTRESWSGAELSDVVTMALAPFRGDDDVFEIDGEPVRVAPQQALALSMALHELSTNAVKYGALSRPGGRVFVEWRVSEEADGPTLTFRWRESGGPPVEPPRRRGFGARLLERGIGGDLRGITRLDYLPTGVVFEAVASL